MEWERGDDRATRRIRRVSLDSNRQRPLDLRFVGGDHNGVGPYWFGGYLPPDGRGAGGGSGSWDAKALGEKKNKRVGTLTRNQSHFLRRPISGTRVRTARTRPRIPDPSRPVLDSGRVAPARWLRLSGDGGGRFAGGKTDSEWGVAPRSFVGAGGWGGAERPILLHRVQPTKVQSSLVSRGEEVRGKPREREGGARRGERRTSQRSNAFRATSEEGRPD